MECITSRANPLLIHARKLAAAAYRRTHGAFLCDGPKLLKEALLWDSSGIQAVICTEGTFLPPLPEAARVVCVPEDVMRSVSPARTPQGVLCICAIPDHPFPSLLTGRRYLALDGVQDPGNVGTILRTADAFGADGLFLLNGCADLYHPKTVRASMGAVFRSPAWTCSADDLDKLLRRSGLSLCALTPGEHSRDIRELHFRRFAAAIGSEGRGLSREVRALCSVTVRIPMRARCESLNAAMAAGILLWEAARGDQTEWSGDTGGQADE